MKTEKECLVRKTERDNGGFSLVELIIVIAVMAVLVGIVGTQVIPYIERARQGRDMQILSGYVTAGMAAYSCHPESAPASAGQLRIEITSSGSGGTDLYDCFIDGTPAPEAQDIADELKNLIAKDYVTNAEDAFQSKVYSGIERIDVILDFTSGNISVVAYKAGNLEITGGDPVQGRL